MAEEQQDNQANAQQEVDLADQIQNEHIDQHASVFAEVQNDTENPAIDQNTEEVTVTPVEFGTPTHDHDSHKNVFARLWCSMTSKKKLSIPLLIILVFAIIAAVPATRYAVAGLFLTKTVQVHVVDSKTDTPVTKATIMIDGHSAETDAKGRAQVEKVKVGKHTVAVSKKYYSEASQSIVVGLSGEAKADVRLEATGRQVNVKVTNKISQKVLSDVTVKADDTEAKTNDEGIANMVVPAGKEKQDIEVAADGFNTLKTSIEVSDKEVKQNEVGIVPSGKIYFLSKRSGKIDVVKTNLDGSDRQTVLAGTGKEEDADTVMLASRDWKYLALKAKRDDKPAKVYLIETDGDKLTTMDEGDAVFNLIGWQDSNIVFTVQRNNYKLWQAKGASIKSYNASSKQLLTLDDTQASGTNDFDAVREIQGSVSLVDGRVVFDKYWSASYYNPAGLSGKQAGLYSISASGADRKTVKSFTNTTDFYLSSYVYEPKELYMRVNASGAETYYEYSGGVLKEDKNIKSDFDKYYNGGVYRTYLLSPSGDKNFWSESRDGKNTLFIGDSNAENGKEIASLSELRQYGWFTDEYILMSKSDSELYIASPDNPQKAMKISDYHKPARALYGYGGGYGGF